MVQISLKMKIRSLGIILRNILKLGSAGKTVRFIFLFVVLLECNVQRNELWAFGIYVNFKKAVYIYIHMKAVEYHNFTKRTIFLSKFISKLLILTSWVKVISKFLYVQNVI